MSHKVMAFVDGENIVTRYESMVAMGYVPKSDVKHEKGLAVWHPTITDQYLMTVQRIAFYQTVVGDNEKLQEANELISGITYLYNEGQKRGGGRLLPRTFKKEKRSSKTKSVDINLTVDALRAARTGACEAIMILSGDGDYLPLIEEIMRHGVQVWVMAFSCGLNKALMHAPDDFFDLDAMFFERAPESTEKEAQSLEP